MEKPTNKKNPASPAGGASTQLAIEKYDPPPPPDPATGKLIGLDIHPDIYTAVVLTGTTPGNARQLQCRADLSLNQLLEWVGKDFTAHDLFLMEAGANSFTLAGKLRDLGLRALVLESGHVGSHARKYADNDKMAAARIAKVFLAGDCPCVWQPDETTRERRELLHLYQTAVRDNTAASNAIKGFLNQYAIRLGKRSLKAPATHAWMLKQHEWSPLQILLLQTHLTQLNQAETRRKDLYTHITTDLHSEPRMLQLMQILGIGVINAFALLAIIGDIHRFATPNKLVAYLGLNPGRLKSGNGKDIKLGIGKHGRSDLRHLLIQGAHTVLRHSKKTAIGKWGMALFMRKGNRNIAVAAVARKLAIQAWHVLMGHPVQSAKDHLKSLCLKLEKSLIILGKQQRAQLNWPASIHDCVNLLLDRIGIRHRNDGSAETPPISPA